MKSRFFRCLVDYPRMVLSCSIINFCYMNLWCSFKFLESFDIRWLPFFTCGLFYSVMSSGRSRGQRRWEVRGRVWGGIWGWEWSQYTANLYCTDSITILIFYVSRGFLIPFSKRECSSPFNSCGLILWSEAQRNPGCNSDWKS